jgi:LCP family protein required for cell wall assembly
MSGKRVGASLGVLVLLAVTAVVFRESRPVTTAVNIVAAPVRSMQAALMPDATKVFGKDRVRVLLIGLDYDYDNLDQETSRTSRSDIIMALNLDFKNHRLNELSVPRDMVATLPSGQQAKINQAQSEGGIKESKSVIAGWLGIPSFDRYIIMRIDTSKDIINAIGGVDVDVENSDALRGTGKNGPVDYDDNWGHLHVHLKPGRQHLNGAQAVGYARFRHDWCSDPCRIMRQQQVVRAIIDRVEHDKLNTMFHAQQLLAVVRKDIETDFTPQEELASVMAFSQLTPRDIHTAQVPYVASVVLPGYGDSIVPDESAKRRLVASLLADPPADLAGGAPSPNVAFAAIRVRVENGTTVPGLAARIAAKLRRRGFTILEIANAPSQDIQVTQVESLPSLATASETVWKALELSGGTANFSPVGTASGTGSDVTIVLGRDIVDEKP